MNSFIIAESLKYIGYGILLSGLLIFLSMSFMLYLNGREMKDYYLLLFGKLTKNDIIFILLFMLTFTFYFYLSNLDTIQINVSRQWYKYNHPVVSSQPFTFNLNINRQTTIDYKEDTIKRYPNFDYRRTNR